MSERILEWEGCVNVRDLGGLPLRDGGQTRFGAVFRADNLRHLTDDGWAELQAHGVRTVVDLRFDLERDDPPVPDGVGLVHVSLFGDHDPDETERIDAVLRDETDAVRAVARLYEDTLERHPARVAAAIRAVGAAPPGGVAVHCFVGKDRTGIVTAVLLDLAGVERAAIVEDYALTEGRVASLVDGWIAGAVTAAERDFRSRISAAPARAMERTLEVLKDRHGGAERYLRDAGLDDDALERARARLLP